MYILSYSAQFFLEWETFQKKFVEKIQTYFMSNNTVRISCRLYDYVEKYCRAG
jgi:hypothetical protein